MIGTFFRCGQLVDEPDSSVRLRSSVWCYGWPGPSPHCMEASRRNGQRPTARNLIRTMRSTPMDPVHGTVTASIPNPPLAGHGGHPLIRQDSSQDITVPHCMPPFLTGGSRAEVRLSSHCHSNVVIYGRWGHDSYKEARRNKSGRI